MSNQDQQASPPPAANKDAGKRFRNIVWITFAIALVLVNVIAEVGYRITGIDIHMFLRISLVVGVTVGASVLGGAGILIGKLGEERPLSGKARDTLGADRRE
ncbi:MAG: hypothetical protein MRY76_08395 [Pseudomonadales bacterium]|nr:hypothetical protein [Pseudomonadales bacterium]